MTNSNRNRTNHFALHFEDGSVVVEHARNSLGGWANMMARVAAANGAERVEAVDAEAGAWSVAGRRFTVEQVQVLG